MSNLFQQIQTDDRNINQLQQNIAQALRPLQKNPLSNGHIMSGLKLVSGINTIQHGLDAPLQGYFFVLQNAPINYYDLQATNLTPSKTLVLVSDTAATVSLYVF